MADHADAAQCVVGRLRVTDVAPHELEAGVTGERRDAAGVDERQQRVEHPHLVPLVHQRPGHVGPDEAGAAGH